MIGCPIDYYTDNIIFNADKSCWAVFWLTGYDYDFLSIEGKQSMLFRTARFLAEIVSEAQILIIPIQQDLKEHFKELRKKIRKEDVLYNQAENHINLTEDYLQKAVKAKGATNDYRTYIVVKLTNDSDEVITDTLNTMKDKIQYIIKDPINAFNVFLNLDTKDIMQSKIETIMNLADDWFFGQQLRIGMQKVDAEETQWVFRRMAYRGLARNIKLFYKSQDRTKQWQPKKEHIGVGKEKVLRPWSRDVVNLFSGVIKAKNRVVTVETDGSTSYQTFMVLTHIPDEIDFPETEPWIYLLQKNDTQAEVCIHIRATEYKQGLHNLDLKKREIDSQIEHVDSAHAQIPDDLMESKVYADEMEKELKDNKFPILKIAVTICLAAENRELLERKVQTIKTKYEDKHFGIERPLSDQRKLFMQFIPSVSVTIKDYVMPITPLILAGGVIGATHGLGDNVGPFIGSTGKERKHVFLDLGLACLKNMSASATFFGNLGVGKSFNANLLLLLNVIYGGYGLIFDPKGERAHWVEELKILDGLITSVCLSPDPKYKGQLDPYNIYRDDLNAANELALNVITELFGIDSKADEYTILLETTNSMESEKIRSIMKLAEIMDRYSPNDKLYEKAQNLARRIRAQKKVGMSMLLFGDGEEEAISIDNRLNILMIQNLKLPSPDKQKKDYSREENVSIVIMMVLSHFAKKFAMVKRPVFKLILFDESWALGKTTEGANLYDFLARMGRSLYTGCIFNGHSVLDIPTEGVRNAITYKFCFNTTNSKEAERMLDFLRLENTQENRAKLMCLGNGECLFQDLYGRVGKLKFDAVFQDIIDVFSTTPKTETNEGNMEEDKSEGSEEDAELIPEPDMDPEQILKNEKEADTEDVLMIKDADLSINIFEREKV